MKTFKNALKDMVNIPVAVGCDVTKHKGEKADIEELENIIIRYHQPIRTQNLFKEIDFDLSNKKASVPQFDDKKLSN